MQTTTEVKKMSFEIIVSGSNTGSATEQPCDLDDVLVLNISMSWFSHLKARTRMESTS